MASWKKVLVADANITVGTINSGTITATLSDITTDISSASHTSVELVVSDGGELKTRTVDFGSNAFNNTSIPSAASDATISMQAGTNLTGSGSFSLDGSATTITFDVVSDPTFTGAVNSATLITSQGATIGGGLIVTGDLTVNGTTTTLNVATLEVEDKMIEVASVETPDTTTADSAGLLIKTGATTVDPTIQYNSTVKLSGFEAYVRDNTTGAAYGDSTQAGFLSVMKFQNAVPTLAPAAGAGAFSYDEQNNELYVYLA